MKRILIAPLDWGLGHATRCIPIIRYLTKKKIEVIIAADKRPLELLKKEFPSFEFIVLPGYGINYPKKGSMIFKIALSIPKILWGIRKEHKMINKIIQEKKIDALISDNRFGLWTTKIPCVFITHQIKIRSPFGENSLQIINGKFINKYNECWIPDYKDENNLSGELSHKTFLPKKSFFIGPLTRFNSESPFNGSGDFKHDIIAILSGPEPQRSLFEDKIVLQGKNSDLNILIVRGIPENEEEKQISKNIKLISHLNSEQLCLAIQQSKIVLCRAGYSTIMDLTALKKKAILVPTPGQTEQEYLGWYLMKKNMVYSTSQKEFNLLTAFQEGEKYSGFKEINPQHHYKQRIDAFLENFKLSSE